MNETRAGAGRVIQNVLISNLFTGHLRGGTGRRGRRVGLWIAAGIYRVQGDAVRTKRKMVMLW